MPVLYSFRRCPYAIRARLALAAAGFAPGPNLELREVSLRAKPPELLEASAKGTVPVLVVPGKRTGSGKENGSSSEETKPAQVLEESLEIMRWALEHRDPQGWWVGRSPAALAEITAMIAENDGPFKHHLDRFKYAARHGAAGEQERPMHRAAALAILGRWNERLARTPEGWLPRFQERCHPSHP
ncbi:glutathione S-transferase N-terminal domain-containing protein [Synechococcus sp. CBW1002]|uniref:glutathione S-transferase N-terminal domain-containing protein n=1 Tax=Synechococcus sp. CBW1002 TaxID=1353134 RepID=UPI0018CE6E0A|nr:glutathione S-transferase N-terminal domain-containing protein [Synechococcus sp. CBW1002]QPN58980.1 glutathione S-transferase N-terminal domain-containing protein [Synechococcus sp. CBW1002]